MHVHGGIRGLQQTVAGGSVRRVNCDSDACAPVSRAAFPGEGVLKAALQA